MSIPRRKIKPGYEAASAAAREIIPEPDAPEAPPKERQVVDRATSIVEEIAQDFGHTLEQIIPNPEIPNPRYVPYESNESNPSPWGRIIEDVVRIDVGSTYERLRDGLSLGEAAHAYSEVARALDVADANYFDAVLLSRAAKLEQERVERASNERLEVLRTAARREIEREKREQAESVKAKTIGRATLEEVRDRVQASWPDEFSSISRRIEEIHAARASCDALVEAWSSRAQSLRKLVERVSPIGTR